MKKLLILLLAPFFGFAQLNLIDLKNMANQKADFSIDYIKQKGYSYRQERDIPDGTKQLYYEKGKLSRTLVVLKVGPNSNNLIVYVPETATNYNEILNSVKKDNFQLINTTSGEMDNCSEYQSKEYFTKLCEIQFPNQSEKSYNITFYRNGMDL